ncbi:MAG: SRPBCC family protein [Proteobacteria bacterium]|nr:SRPBCC family protein [Pseudomonadota bacterium]
MAAIHIDIPLNTPAQTAWDAVRDVGAIHTRLARGFVTDTQLEGDSRVVTFANGFVAREAIIDLDDKRRRLAYSVRSEALEHHHASIEIVEGVDGRARMIWQADLKPDSAAERIEPMMQAGAKAMQATLEGVV